MTSVAHRGPFLDRGHRLEEAGLRVRARLARPSDVRLASGLLERIGVAATPLDLARALRYDPRRRVVACLTTLVGSTETMVALGAVDLDLDKSADPDLVLVDPRHAPELERLLRRTLAHGAEARHDGHAA